MCYVLNFFEKKPSCAYKKECRSKPLCAYIKIPKRARVLVCLKYAFSCTYIAKSGRQSFLCAYFRAHWPCIYKNEFTMKESVGVVAELRH